MSDFPLKRIAIYCRVSTDEQAKEGVSLEEQRTRLQAYCRAMGWTVEIVEFIDDGYSAKNLNRPALNSLLQQIKNGDIAKLMVTKLDRLSRRLLDLLQLIELFHQYSVSFISTSESFDTDTPSGRLTLQVLGAVAEFERERIRERVFDNMLHAAKTGKWLTQHPYGYRLDEKKLVIFEPEAEIVKRIFHMFVNEGLGYYSIAKKLNEEGIPSRQNKEWSLRSVKLMLANPVYIGTLAWNRIDSSKKKRESKDENEWIVIPNAHPAIIDQDTWDIVQERMNKPQVPSRAKTSPHILGGLLKCGKCGASMSIDWSGWPKRHRVYRCSAYKNKGTCDSKPYRADDVETWFKKGIMELIDSIDTTCHEVTIQKVQKENKEKIEQKMKHAKERYSRQVEAYTAGLIELNDLAKEKEKMEQSILEAQKRMETNDSSHAYSELETKLNTQEMTILESFAILPIEEAKARLRLIVDKVVLHGEENLELVIAI
ncbi:recombinase family protein [Fodinisporobacter ferrooxydans]|uniref:Recombinase family protein n=1 Tax=Fodinisporobacter ferrooxydans TaxID=2901836 RepID=A0ABY4CJZ9_9BACL|nr:recombinase family protein [Alicyclobacillaceae bacterium MYW30-H2]